MGYPIDLPSWASIHNPAIQAVGIKILKITPCVPLLESNRLVRALSPALVSLVVIGVAAKKDLRVSLSLSPSLSPVVAGRGPRRR